MGKKADLEETIQDSFKYSKFDSKGHEGYLGKIIPTYTIYVVGIVILIFGLIFSYRSYSIQVVEGEIYKNTSVSNTFEEQIVFANRGVIFDRNNEILAGNQESEDTEEISRMYPGKNGIAHLIGYVNYPKKDENGIYFRRYTTGVSGVELLKDRELRGKNGAKIIETDATGQMISGHILKEPIDGNDVVLSIDSALSEALYEFLENTINTYGFLGGAGLLMDLENGELLTSVSYPEFNPKVLSDGENDEKIKEFIEDDRKIFLNRAVSGLFSPGSIIKPFIAIGALEENIINPNNTINVDGPISIPHPNIEDQYSLFKDWKLHGVIDLIDAIAISSNIYFYRIGGGYENQEGLGIERIEGYLNQFKLTDRTDTSIASEPKGVIPTPEWKKEIFSEEWRLGDTYNTSIGQYGLQITPLQVLRGITGIATGKVIEPTIIADNNPRTYNINISKETLDTVREGMRESVRRGTASGLNLPYVEIAGKTGTAEVGSKNKKVNSWIGGFFPYENPKYAFVIVLEKGPTENTIGGVFVARQFFDWININMPEFFAELNQLNI